MAGSPWGEERKEHGQVRNQTPISGNLPITCLHRQCRRKEFSLCMGLDGDRPCSDPGPLSDHSSCEVVNVTEVLIPEAKGKSLSHILGPITWDLAAPVPENLQCLRHLQFPSHLQGAILNV